MAMLVALMLVTLGPISATSTVSGISSPGQVPNACLYFLALTLLVLVFLLFPSGQFVPSFTRWTLVITLAVQVPSIFFPHAPFTLVYGALTALLVGVYVGLVIGLQALLRSIISHDSGVAIVISTLAIYVLFQPLRRRIQQIIDRRFYGSKYDAAKTVATFSTTLRQEVDPEQLREQLLAVVQQTMQPTHVSLWLRLPAHVGTKPPPWRATPPAP